MRMNKIDNNQEQEFDRRDMLSRSASTVAGFLSLSIPNANAEGSAAMQIFEAKAMGTDPKHPIVVIGAGGKCGLLCTKILASQNLYVKAITRSARTVLDEPSEYVSYAAGDVTDISSITNVLKDASGVIFAASASKKGGDAAHVDYFGVANTAKACITNQVPKLAVISSLAVTRPQSIGFKITNIFGRIMDYKVAGEIALRGIYATTSPKISSYVIIRPGGLQDGPSEGPSSLAISQGDICSGEISREDVSRTTIAALLSPKVENASLEVFDKKGYAKSVKDKDMPAGFDDSKLFHTSSSFDGLFDGIYSDGQMTELFPDIISNYKGTKVESLESF